MVVVLANVRLIETEEPTSVRISDGLIAGVGAEVRAEAGDEVFNCDGRWLMPGLWDQHVHMSQWAIHQRRLDVAAATSAREAAEMCAAARVDDQPLIAAGYHDSLWPDQINVELLDEISPLPTVLVSADLHGTWANTAALAYFGMPGAGSPVGVRVEEDAFELQRRISAVPDQVLDSWVVTAAQSAATRGVVGVVDMEMTFNHDVWRRRLAAGFNQLRVRASIYPQFLDHAIELGLCSGQVDPDFPLLEVGPFKVITDGSLNTRTAYCTQPYPGSDSRGIMPIDASQLTPMLIKARDAGLWSAVHAIGDEANRIVLDCFEATGAPGRVEHAQLLNDADVARFAQLGLIASVQPQHLLDDRPVTDAIWRGWTHRAYRFADLHRAGANLVFGSDAPVAKLDPWHQIQAATERTLPGDSPWHPEQCLDINTALAASVETRIVAGHVADLVLLDADPLTASGAQLREMPVAATIVAGRFTHKGF